MQSRWTLALGTFALLAAATACTAAIDPAFGQNNGEGEGEGTAEGEGEGATEGEGEGTGEGEGEGAAEGEGEGEGASEGEGEGAGEGEGEGEGEGGLPGCPTGPRRAMWSWHASDVTNTTAAADQIDWAVAYDVGVIYVHGPGLLDSVSHKNSLAAFITAAHAECIEVELLFGDNTWALAAEHSIPIDKLDQTIAFADDYPDAAPDGIHYDVEPHTTDEWDTDLAGTQTDFLDLLEILSATASAAHLRLTMDVGFWYDGTDYRVTYDGVEKRFSEHIQDRVDRISIMDYRDTASAIETLAATEMTYAETIGKEVVVGVETNVSSEGDNVSFGEETRTYMMGEIEDVETHYAASAAFAGIAFHDYDGWVAQSP